MASNFTITNAGITAVESLSPDGPLIFLDHFKVGSAFGYDTSSGTDTALHGTELYSGLIKNYQIFDASTVQLTLEMNEAIGDFQFGEIGIYTTNNVLFAIYAYSELQQKRASIGNQVGNRRIIEAKLKLVNLVPSLYFPIINPGVGLPQIPRFSTLAPSNPQANAYSVLWGDGCGNPGIALWDPNNQLWGFPTHVTHFDGTVQGGDIASVIATDPALSAIFDVQPGRYVLQVTSGTYKGFVREVNAFDPTTGVLSIFPMLPAPLQSGDTFRVNVSNCFWLENGSGVQWAGTIEYNAVASRINTIMGTPNLQSDPNNTGYGDPLLPLLLIPKRPSAANWSALYDKLRRGRKHQGASPTAIDQALATWDYFFRNSNPYGYGLYTYANAYNTLLSGVADLETNKDQRAINTLIVNEPPEGRVQQQHTWSGQLTHTGTFSWAGDAHQYGWWNSGCRIGHHGWFGDPADQDDNYWVTTLAQYGTTKVAYTATYQNDTTQSSATGFYDMAIGDPPVKVGGLVNDSGKSIELWASRPSADQLTLTAKFNQGDINQDGHGYATGLVDANYGLFSQFLLEKHSNLYLQDIAYPTAAYSSTFELAGGGTAPAPSPAPTPAPGSSSSVAGTYSVLNRTLGSSITLSRPTGTATGDQLLALIAMGGASQFSTALPTGWVKQAERLTGNFLEVISKTAADADPPSWTFQLSGSHILGGTLVDVRGLLIDIVGSISAANGLTATAPSVLAPSNGSLLLAFFAASTASVTFSAPPGMQPLVSSVATVGAGQPSWAIFMQTVNAGSTGDKVAATDQRVAKMMSGFLVSLGPPGSSAAPVPTPAPGPTPAPAPAPYSVTLQAETFSGATVDTEFAGYTGAGHTNWQTAPGSPYTGTFTVPADGAYDIGIRYGTYGSQINSIQIDNQAQILANYDATYPAWKVYTLSAVQLTAGTHTIVLDYVYGYTFYDAVTVATSSAAAPAPTPAPGPVPAPPAPAPAPGVAPFIPFGSRPDGAYPFGIRPSASNASMDASLKSLYDRWKGDPVAGTSRLRKAPTFTATRGIFAGQTITDAYYVDSPQGIGTDSSNNTIYCKCVSEAIGYGMLLTVLFAGYDASAKLYFDGMFKTARGLPAYNSGATANANLYLMDYAIGLQASSTDFSSQGGGYNAADGDQDIAMALLMAHRQWGSTGAINYWQEAINTINAIKAADYDPTHSIMYVPRMPDGTHDCSRTSDYMIGHYRQYKKATGDVFWDNARTSSLAFAQNVINTYAPHTHFPPGWIYEPFVNPRPSPGGKIESGIEGIFDANAIRDPWRWGVDYLFSGDSAWKTLASNIVTTIKTIANNDTTRLSWAYGTQPNNPDAAVAITGSNLYFEPATAGTTMVGGMTDAAHQAWVDGCFSNLTTRFSTNYYSAELSLLSMVVASGNWWLAIPG